MPVGSRKKIFCIVPLVPKKIFNGLGITATAVTFEAITRLLPVQEPEPQDTVLFE